MQRLIAFFLLSLLWAAFARLSAGDASENQGAGAQVLLCLSAHPDDEDGAALAYYSQIKRFKTYSIFFTRGEGGQNETGPELYEDLGVLRTEETLNAARIIGTKPCFLGFPDFGFSKTARETFARWGGKDSVLARLVYYIRALRPDVIITNHDTITEGEGRQHGNHQAVGITAYEAFGKAADSNYHREQLNGSIGTWQPRKLFFRSFEPGRFSGDSLVTIDILRWGENGKTIEETALLALGQHRSQGMDRIRSLASPSYRLVRSDSSYPVDPADLFSGLKPGPEGQVPEAVIFAGVPPISLIAAPSCIPPGEPPTIKIELINRTGGACSMEISAISDTSKLFRKRYRLVGYKTFDTLSLGRVNLQPGHLTFRAESRTEGLDFHVERSVSIRAVSAVCAPGCLVGLVKTYDNTLHETLESFGVHYTLLDSDYVASGELGRFSSILLDLRAYRYRPDVIRHTERLREFVRNGGNLICFYNRPEEWNGHGYSPYPLLLTTERVTEEDATVTVLEPRHALFNQPNRITGNDWTGWVQERSLYLPSADTLQTSSRYQRLLAMSDTGERQPSTSLLWCRYGRGSYTYVSLALYRQLRILQEGGVKLFFNLISQPKN